MIFSAFLESLTKVKNKALLGEIAHAKLSPPYRLKLAKEHIEKRKTAKNAAVLSLFYPNSIGETHLVLILRKTYRGVHSAQVGFPGGKVEIEDTDLIQTALRETQEEIGVPINSMQVVRELTPLYIPPSNFIVHPFIGFTEGTPLFVKQDTEVEAVIEVSLKDLMNDSNVITTKVATSYKIDIEVPAFVLNEQIVWGATAMMLSELKLLLNEVI